MLDLMEYAGIKHLITAIIILVGSTIAVAADEIKLRHFYTSKIEKVFSEEGFQFMISTSAKDGSIKLVQKAAGGVRERDLAKELGVFKQPIPVSMFKNAAEGYAKRYGCSIDGELTKIFRLSYAFKLEC